MHSAELNVPQNHVYLFKPRGEKEEEDRIRAQLVKMVEVI